MTMAFLTVQEAAERLRLSRPTVRRMVRSGKLQAWRTPGGHLRFDPAEVTDAGAQLGLPSAPAGSPKP